MCQALAKEGAGANHGISFDTDGAHSNPNREGKMFLLFRIGKKKLMFILLLLLNDSSHLE